MYYAQITNGVVTAVTEAHSVIDAPDMIAISSLDGALLGNSYADGVFTPPAAPAMPQHATKQAFQNRFPLAANGVSTKWDLMTLFLNSDSYAASLGVTGTAMHELRLLITTGVNRLNASPYVDMSPEGKAAALTLLMMQSFVPVTFRLSAGERETMFDTPLADDERYEG